MKRSYPSGAEKKKKRATRKAEEERGKRTLDIFLKPPIQISNELPLHSNNNTQDELAQELEKNISNQDTSPSGDKRLSSDGEPEPYNKDLNLPTTSNEIEHQRIECQPKTPNPLLVDEVPSTSTADYFNDPATWSTLNVKSRDMIVLKGPPNIPNVIPRDSTGRGFPMSVFKKRMTNGEIVERDWLVWSQQASALFCFPCCLFKPSRSSSTDSFVGGQASKLVCQGISDNWKKVYEKTKSHESNVNHVQNYVKWKELLGVLKGNRSAIDEALQKQIKEEEGKWIKLLSAVIDVVLFLAERNMAFRGSHSTIEADDCGNFLSTLKLIGKYNSDIKGHLDAVANAREKGNRMQASYLSWETQNEFLEICGSKVKNKIIQEINDSLYYSLIVDGTPDVSHKEQLVFVIRYILQKNESWDVYERFLQITDFEQKTGEAIAEQIKTVLKNCKININLCRGQSYDNASNMSGKFKGVKTRILQETPQAYFSPCSAHSLNLCGVHAMETSAEVKSFFGNVQKLYKLFALSPSRWKILQNTANVSLHSVSTTRWSARIDAVRPLVKNYCDILAALEKIDDDVDLHLTSEIQADLSSLIGWMKSFDFILISTIWFKILQCMDDSNKVLQSSKLTLQDAKIVFSGLYKDIDVIRNSWEKILEESKLVATSFNISPSLKHTKIRKQKRFFDELDTPEHNFQSNELKFKVQVFLPTLDLLSSEIKNLENRMEELGSLFLPVIISTETEMTEENLEADCLSRSEALHAAYPKDLDKAELYEELKIYQKLLRDGLIESNGNINASIGILNQIFKKGLQNVLPQICVVLRLLAVMPISVASGERAFSKMALIKNKLRSAMGEDRLNHLLMLSIEHDFVKSLDFGDVIQEFARKKARKIVL